MKGLGENVVSVVFVAFSMSEIKAPNPYKPPKREDYDQGGLGDVRYEWAVERYLMERGKPYAAAHANDGNL